MTNRTTRIAVPLAALGLALTAALPASASTTAVGTQLHIDFDHGESLAPGSVVVDDSGTGASGVVDVQYGGSLRAVQGVSGSRAARFPTPCNTEPCPNGLIRIDDQSDLDPGTAAFEWGASLQLAPSETSRGANVVQKGLYNQAGGQWKLQVDGGAGYPSCLLSGVRSDGTTLRRKVTASVSVADGDWHRVSCRRTSSELSVLVDGIVRGSASAPAVRVSSSAPVTIGAKSVKARDNDQWFGVLDEVFMRLL